MQADCARSFFLIISSASIFGSISLILNHVAITFIEFSRIHQAGAYLRKSRRWRDGDFQSRGGFWCQIAADTGIGFGRYSNIFEFHIGLQRIE